MFSHRDPLFASSNKNNWRLHCVSNLLVLLHDLCTRGVGCMHLAKNAKFSLPASSNLFCWTEKCFRLTPTTAKSVSDAHCCSVVRVRLRDR
eukprot:4183452-Amphidinium_carterae.4